MVTKAPERSEVVTVRLSRSEKDRLQEFAIARDLRVGQALRQFVNERLGVIGTQEEPRDGRAAH